MENYLIAILVIVTILLIVQALVFVGLYFLVRRAVALAERVGQLQTRAEYLLNNTEPIVKSAQGLVSDLKEAADYFAQGAQNITAITEIAKDEAAEVRNLQCVGRPARTHEKFDVIPINS